MAQIGKAYIEVTADLKKFPAELRSQLKAALKAGLAGVEFDGLDEKAGKAGEEAAAHMGDGFEREERRSFKRKGEGAGRSILSGLKSIFSRNSSDGGGFLSSVGGFFGSMFSGIGDAAKTATSAGGSAAGSASSALGSVSSSFSSIGGGAGGLLSVATYAVLIPVAIQLAGALVQLGAALFALPAIAGVGVAAIAPLIIAFQGFGEAVGAGLSGDTEKFNEALKGLAPSARGVVKELVALGPQFKAIKQDVQGAFFAPLKGFFTEFGRTLLPVARRGLTQVATSLGGVARALGDTFTAPENVKTFNALFASTSRIVSTMEPALANLAQAMLNLIQPALPFLERGATLFRDWAGTVEAFTHRIASDGTLSGWLGRAFHILKSLVGVVKEVSDGFITLLGGEIGDQGTDFIDQFKEKFGEFVAFLKSPDGQEAIHNITTLLKAVGAVFLFLIAMEPAILMVFNGIFDAVRIVGRGLEILGGWLVVAAKAVGAFFVGAWNWIKSAGSAIGRFFTETIPSWFDSIVGFFASLPDRILGAISSLQHTLRDWFVGLLEAWYQGILFKVGQVIAIFLSLPQLIPAALSVLGEKLNEAWDFAFEAVKGNITGHFNELMALFMSLPGLLADAGRAIWSWSTDLWNTVWSSTTEIIQSGVNSVIAFFYGIPGRIAALGPKVLDAARGIGHKIAQGLSEIGNFATDLGQKVLNALKTGINWVINSINSGIASIDNQLPGTLPRIPTLAKGAVVDSPTMALIGEAGPEVVIPLTNRTRAQQLAEESGLLPMLNKSGSGTNVTVIAYLDGTGAMIPVARTVVSEALDQQGEELPYARAA